MCCRDFTPWAGGVSKNEGVELVHRESLWGHSGRGNSGCKGRMVGTRECKQVTPRNLMRHDWFMCSFTRCIVIECPQCAGSVPGIRTLQGTTQSMSLPWWRSGSSGRRQTTGNQTCSVIYNASGGDEWDVERVKWKRAEKGLGWETTPGVGWSGRRLFSVPLHLPGSHLWPPAAP